MGTLHPDKPRQFIQRPRFPAISFGEQALAGGSAIQATAGLNSTSSLVAHRGWKAKANRFMHHEGVFP